MKSAAEIKMGQQRESAESLVKKEQGAKALDMTFSFSHLECVIDVKLEEGWIRYLLIEGGDEPDKLRRIS
jgi:hypothetical protein